MGDSSGLLAWLALGLGLLALALGVRIASSWRDWKMLPLLAGLAAVSISPVIEILSSFGLVSTAGELHLLSYRSLLASTVALGAVVALRYLIEQERGLRRAVERTATLVRSNANLERELVIRRESEREISDAADALRRVFQLSPALMCTLDRNGRFLMVNPAFGQALGYAESELVGGNYVHFVHPDDLASTREEGLKLQRGETRILDHENRYRASDGSYRVLSWHTTFVASEGIFYGAATDVTDKVLRRDAIRRIYQLTPVAMCTFDWDGIISAVNPVFPQLLGFEESELIGRHYLDLLHPEDRAAALVQDATMHASETTVSAYETRMICKDGSYRTLSWDVTSAPDHRTFYGVTRDVTDARRDERQMTQRRDEMAHMLRLQTIGEMASEMSHELNQPLGAIVNYANGLATRMRNASITTAAAVAVVDKIGEQALRGGELIRKVLLFARRGDLDVQDCSINDVIRDTVTLLVAGGISGTDIMLALDETLPSMCVDRSQLQQVFLNLIRNALDAVEDRTGLRVLVRSSQTEAAEILVSVSDNGPGIPQADSERIFDAFFTTRPGGVGLGLSISRSIVQAHHGRLWVESTPGEGTTFHVALPLVAADAYRRSAASSIADSL